MNTPDIEILFDASPSIGMGHYKRCIALGEILVKRGFKVSVKGVGDAANRLIANDVIYNGNSKVVLYDSTTNIDELLEFDKKTNRTTIALDYFGDNCPDIAIGVNPQKIVKSNVSSYAGLNYHIIREEFHAIKKRKDTNNYILVVIGGADVRGQSAYIAKLALKTGVPVKLVLGEYANRIALDNSGIEIIENPRNLADLHVNSLIAHTNGGGCMFEAMFFGKPVVAWPQSAQEQSMAEYVKYMGCIVGIGEEGFTKLSKIDLAVVARKASIVMDGRGIYRITDIISHEIHRSRDK